MGYNEEWMANTVDNPAQMMLQLLTIFFCPRRIYMGYNEEWMANTVDNPAQMMLQLLTIFF